MGLSENCNTGYLCQLKSYRPGKTIVSSWQGVTNTCSYFCGIYKMKKKYKNITFLVLYKTGHSQYVVMWNVTKMFWLCFLHGQDSIFCVAPSVSRFQVDKGPKKEDDFTSDSNNSSAPNISPKGPSLQSVIHVQNDKEDSFFTACVTNLNYQLQQLDPVVYSRQQP